MIRFPHAMLERLTGPDSTVAAKRRIGGLIDAHAEWFFVQSDGSAVALRNTELEVTATKGRLILSCWTEKGSRTWRIIAWDWSGEKLVLQASRRMGAERPLLELIPRASASVLAATVRAARQARCDQLAKLACSLRVGAKIERAALSPGMRRGQPGRYARIVLRLKHERIAVTAPVVASRASDVDALLSSALLWFQRTSERARPPYVQQLWLLLESESIKPLAQRLTLLRQSLRDVIVLYELADDWREITEVPGLERGNLWKGRLGRFPPVSEPTTSGWANVLVAQMPEAIDVVHARHGETLRYHGLPFARVRSVASNARVWFGIEGSRRRMLEERTGEEFANLFRDLQRHRSAKASDRHHALYRIASEAWLESLLRRDVARLDPGLIVAPLHAQFRTARGGRLGVRPIDLLALRHDGRLVVIELKVSEDREHVFQGVEYWRRVEAHRRRGHIAQAKLFGHSAIRNELPLVYLVAPTLRFHPSFQSLAQLIAPDIEIYRFDINEDWRAGVRVMRRMRAN